MRVRVCVCVCSVVCYRGASRTTDVSLAAQPSRFPTLYVFLRFAPSGQDYDLLRMLVGRYRPLHSPRRWMYVDSFLVARLGEYGAPQLESPTPISSLYLPPPIPRDNQCPSRLVRHDKTVGLGRTRLLVASHADE